MIPFPHVTRSGGRRRRHPGRRPDAGGRRTGRDPAAGRCRDGRRGRPGPVLVVLTLLLVAVHPVDAAATPSGAAGIDAAGRVGRVALPVDSADAGPSPLGFRSPVGAAPVVVTVFAPPSTRYGAGHRGVDLAVPAGSAIRAAGAGTVVFAGRLADRPLVSVEHDGGLRTTYEPVEPSVARGARVAAGEVIGVLEAGHPGCPGMDCLHWGARLPDRVYLDPLLLLGSWPVRLWPWEES